MIPTPNLSHLTQQDYEHVYEPAEDTFILLDALEQEAKEIINRHPVICLEIGSGSGCVSSFIGGILGPSSVLYLCTDINPHACRCTFATGQQNKIPLEPLLASLELPLRSRLQGSVDVVIFNPPYVPTVPDEADDAQESADIQGSWAGGSSGMQVTDQFLQNVRELLSPQGSFYLVAVKTNDIPSIRHRILADHGLSSEIILQRRAGREHLFVIKFSRNL